MSPDFNICPASSRSCPFTEKESLRSALPPRPRSQAMSSLLSSGRAYCARLVTAALHDMEEGGKIRACGGRWGIRGRLSFWRKRISLWSAADSLLPRSGRLPNICCTRTTSPASATSPSFTARGLRACSVIRMNWPRGKSAMTSKPSSPLTREMKPGRAERDLSPLSAKTLRRRPANAVAVICGPPVMTGPTLPVFFDLGFSKENILTSLEMRMKCGIGKMRPLQRRIQVCLFRRAGVFTGPVGRIAPRFLMIKNAHRCCAPFASLRPTKK